LFLLMWLLRHIENIRLSCKHEPSVFCMALNSYKKFMVDKMVGEL